MKAKLIFGLLGAVLAGNAAEVKSTDTTIPLVQDGGGWSTTITLLNLGAKPAGFDINFSTPKGDPWTTAVKISAGLKAAGDVVTGVIPPGGSVTIQTPNSGDSVTRGYATLFTYAGGPIGGVARISNGASAMTMGLAPNLELQFSLPFDTRAGSATSLVLVSRTPYALIDFAVRDSAGARVLSDRYQFQAADPRTQVVIDLAAAYPQLSGTSGTIDCHVSFPGAGQYDEQTFAALALQLDAAGAATLVSSMAPGK